MRFVKATNDDDVVFAVMLNEFACDIAVNGTDCRGSSRTFELEAHTGPEFRDLENSQARDFPSKHALLRHDFPLKAS